MARRSILPFVLLAPIGLGIALFVGVYVVRPRIVLHDFDAMLRRHPVGAPVADLANDPFVDRATMLILDPKTIATHGATSHRDAIRAWTQAHPAGTVDLMWTHTPPFGRVTAVFTYDAGRIVDVKTHDLD